MWTPTPTPTLTLTPTPTPTPGVVHKLFWTSSRRAKNRKPQRFPFVKMVEKHGSASIQLEICKSISLTSYSDLQPAYVVTSIKGLPVLSSLHFGVCRTIAQVAKEPVLRGHTYASISVFPSCDYLRQFCVYS